MDGELIIAPTLPHLSESISLIPQRRAGRFRDWTSHFAALHERPGADAEMPTAIAAPVRHGLAVGYGVDLLVKYIIPCN